MLNITLEMRQNLKCILNNKPEVITAFDLRLLNFIYKSNFQYDWFGNVGTNGQYDFYEYILNYKQPFEIEYLFKLPCEFRVTEV